MSTSAPCLSTGIWENGEDLAENRLNFVSKVPGSYDQTEDSEDRASQRLANVADCMLWISFAAHEAKANGKPMGKVRFGISDVHAVNALNSDRAERFQSFGPDDKKILEWIVFVKNLAQVEVEFFQLELEQRSSITKTIETIESSRGWRSEASRISLSQRRDWTKSFIETTSTLRDNASSRDFRKSVIKRLENCLTFIEELENPGGYTHHIRDSPKKQATRLPFSQDAPSSPSKRAQERKLNRPAPYSRSQRPTIFGPRKSPQKSVRRRGLEADDSPFRAPLESWDSSDEEQEGTVYIHDKTHGYLGYSRTGETPDSAKEKNSLPPWMAEERWQDK